MKGTARTTTRRGAKRSEADAPDDANLLALLDHLGRLLAREYVARLRREDKVTPTPRGSR